MRHQTEIDAFFAQLEEPWMDAKDRETLRYVALRTLGVTMEEFDGHLERAVASGGTAARQLDIFKRALRHCRGNGSGGGKAERL